MHSNSLGVATGQQARTRWSADSGGNIEIGELPPLCCHSVEVRCAMDFGPEWFNIAVAKVVTKYDDEIGFLW